MYMEKAGGRAELKEQLEAMLLLIGLQNSNRAILGKEHLFYAKFEWKLINSNLFYKWNQN